MTVKQQIADYLAALPERKRGEVTTLHGVIQSLMKGRKLWVLDGKDERGKAVTNPNIGYGSLTMTYADGSSREFYQVGISANTGGISVYVMGLKDKKHLVNSYSATIGKATVTGYCIKFKSLNDINLKVLEAAILDGVAQTSA